MFKARHKIAAAAMATLPPVIVGFTVQQGLDHSFPEWPVVWLGWDLFMFAAIWIAYPTVNLYFYYLLRVSRKTVRVNIDRFTA